MSSISELKAELKEAKFQLRSAQRVDWGSGGSGMARYDDQLALVTKLTNQLNAALKEGGRR